MALLGNPDYRRRIGQANALPQSWPQVVPPPQSSFVPQPPIGAIPSQQPPQAPVGLLGGSPGPGGGPDPRSRSEDVVSNKTGWGAVRGLLGSALTALSMAGPTAPLALGRLLGGTVVGANSQLDTARGASSFGQDGSPGIGGMQEGFGVGFDGSPLGGVGNANDPGSFSPQGFDPASAPDPGTFGPASPVGGQAGDGSEKG